MKVMILGAGGMLGHALAEVFKDHELILLDREEVDITREGDVKKMIKENNPEVIINAAAYTNVDEAELHRETAMQVNGNAVGYIAKAASGIDAILVHYSTDYIFNGELRGGYDEHSNEYEPVNIYGESKLLGEQLLQKNTGKFYLIRTSWLFGLHGKNFVTTMLRLGKDHGSLKVVNDQHGRPTYTLDLAWATRSLIEDKSEYGIYHLTNTVALQPFGKLRTQRDSITWHDFAHEIFHQAQLDVDVIPCNSDEFSQEAQRPEFSILLNTKWPLLRDWRLALQDYLSEL